MTALTKTQTDTASLVRQTLDEQALATFAEEAGAGLEGLNQKDFSLPFISLMQGLSPQLNKNHAKYVKGAEQGDIYNPATDTLYKEGTEVIGVTAVRVYNEWKPKRGGFVRSYESLEDAENNRQPENEVIETVNWFVFIKGTDGTWSPAILSFKASGLKAARAWNTALASVRLPGVDKQAPVYATGWKLTSVPQTNEKGTWYNYKFTRIPGWTSVRLVEEARALRKLILEGKAKADASQDNDGQALADELTNDDLSQVKF